MTLKKDECTTIRPGDRKASVFVFRIPRFHTINMLYLIYPISWVITSAMLFVCAAVVLKKKLGAKEK